MITQLEIEATAAVDPAAISLYLEAKGWRRAKTPPDWEVQPWNKRGYRAPIVQFLTFPNDWTITQHGQILHHLSAEENRSPQAILWDWQATSYARLRLTCFPRLRPGASSSLIALSSLLSACVQAIRQAALQVERSGHLDSFRTSAFLPTLTLLPHETTDYDLMIGSTDPAAAPVWSEFLALLGRPATPITPRRELEPGIQHLVMEPIRQALKAVGITELAGQYLQAGEPNLPGLGLHFRLDASGSLLLGGDD